MIPEHYEFLNKIGDKYNLSEIDLYYNTNSTMFIPDKYIDMYKSMKSVLFSLSVDDIGERFEYQRKNAMWGTTEEVMLYFLSLDHAEGNIHTLLDPTVSIFNVYYMPEIISHMDDLGFMIHNEHIHNVEGSDSAFNIQTLSTIQKAIISKHLLKSKHGSHPWIVKTIKYMNQHDYYSEHVEMDRIKQIKLMDTSRSERFDNVFPEMNEIIGIYND